MVQMQALRDRHGRAWWLRALAPDDGTRLAAYFESLSADDYANFHPHALDVPTAHAIAAGALDPGALRLILFADDGGTGAVAGYGFLLDWADREPLLGMSLAPAARGRGLGTAFTRHLVERARQAGKRCVNLTVYRDNVAAMRSYRGAGFDETGHWSDDWGGTPREEVAMRCAIASTGA